MGHCFLTAILTTLVCQGAAVDSLRIVPDAAVLKLDDLGLYRVGLAYRGQPEHEMPTGWSGPFDEQTGLACQPAGVQNGRQALLCTVPGGMARGSRSRSFTSSFPAPGERCCEGRRRSVPMVWASLMESLSGSWLARENCWTSIGQTPPGRISNTTSAGRPAPS